MRPGLIGNDGTRLYVTADHDAERAKIAIFDMADANPQPVDVVPEDDAVLVNAADVDGHADR